MSLSKSKCLYSNDCLQFLKWAVPLQRCKFWQPWHQANAKEMRRTTVTTEDKLRKRDIRSVKQLFPVQQFWREPACFHGLKQGILTQGKNKYGRPPGTNQWDEQHIKQKKFLFLRNNLS